jgi:hypothetical protein|nr:MAG TPA: hypothetical protein [Caudoviricetes sp.]DAS92890.1 MAG TPA: hypothetical protein [Caudoviricetes sp.]
MKSLISKRKEKQVSVKGMSVKVLKDMLPNLSPKRKAKVKKELLLRGVEV